MASIEEYLKKQDTALLESLLRAYCDGREDMMPEVALCICQILALRNPRLPEADTALRRMCRQYLL